MHLSIKTGLQVVVLMLLSVTIKAQQKYFVYIKNESGQAFSVKINDKVLSSSETGYMIIPKLTTGSYPLSIVFPKTAVPEQLMTLTIGNADAGYLLKDFREKGWGLFNIRTTEITMNGGGALQKPADGDDVFINVLANAANMPVTAPKPVTGDLPKIITDTVIAVSTTVEVIEKISSTKAPEGRSYIYVVRNGVLTDTIRIFISADAAVVPAKENAPKAEVKMLKVKEEKFLDIDMRNANADTVNQAAQVKVPVELPGKDSAKSVQQGGSVKKDRPIVSFNSDCKAFADEADFLKIRKKMAAAVSEDGMMSVAKKFFKAKCWSTEQVKNLSLLFLTDSGKYNFFDAAYPRTHDTQNFASLQSQLRDVYFINRFRAMVRN